MRYYEANQNYVVILAKGEELMDCLRQFARESGVSAAWLQGIGAALEAEVGYYHLDSQSYQWKAFSGPLEITNLQGNIVNLFEPERPQSRRPEPVERVKKQGEPALHVHVTMANDTYGCIGGHVKKLTVSATCEIFVQKINLALTRQRDTAVGLELLQPASE
ncbi:DUF296 domain-containing protein [Candidatus Saccharibacteria bacterium]|nr:DUF296 domain-containing protein [Candidatus Saccharibacteria bacterium]